MPSKDVMRRQAAREKAQRRLERATTAPKPHTFRPFPRCPAGHEMARTWKRGTACWRCDMEAADRQREQDTRPVWPGGRVPDTLTMIEASTGRVIRHTIPKHLRAQARAQRKRRGPRRRRQL